MASREQKNISPSSKSMSNRALPPSWRDQNRRAGASFQSDRGGLHDNAFHFPCICGGNLGTYTGKRQNQLFLHTYEKASCCFCGRRRGFGGDATQFDPPADFTKHDSMMSLMMSRARGARPR
jgi:hypothetical protein